MDTPMPTAAEIREAYLIACLKVKQLKELLDNAKAEMQDAANAYGQIATAAGVRNGEHVRMGADGQVFRIKWNNGDVELEPVKTTVV
jgi:hypothetical protein